MDFVGRAGSVVLFSSDNIAVIVDENTNLVLETGKVETLTASAVWDATGERPNTASFEIASAAITSLDIHVFAENDRLYTIPKAVQAEARRGLDWHKAEGRGGTSVGMNTARTLAKGGQIGLRKVRHIAKYFPRHEVDKKGTGYKPGEDNYPSNGRIAWALWGGDAGQRWASAIVEREDAKSASTFEIFESVKPVELNSFVASASGDESSEFFIRLLTDGSGFDRLYRFDQDGVLSVWDDGVWSDLGESFSSFVEIDAELDISDVKQHLHLPVDPEAALVASAYLDNSPANKALVSDVNEEEALLAAAALDEIDWSEIDSVTAAAPVPPSSAQYTPEERSKNASSQVRDATGKFAKSGSAVTVKGYNGQGVIQSIDSATSSATVKMQSGQTVTVPANQTSPAEIFTPSAPQLYQGTPLDVSGILGLPRNSSNPALAQLDNRLPPLTNQDISTLLSDWPKWVADQRANVTAPPSVPVTDVADEAKVPNAYNDPYLRKWLDTKSQGKSGNTVYPNRSWYNPVRTDAVDAKKSAKAVHFSATYSVVAGGNAAVALTPKTSDVPPVYMAIVAPDDPQAVMGLICLIPSDSKGTAPAVFSYKKGQWEKDDATLRDLKSPTPPPVVVLDDKALKSVIDQANQAGKEQKTDSSGAPVTASIDAYLALFMFTDRGMLPLSAAGGLDRNRGNAERLRHYWTHGEGAAKIRWGEKGDWSRCYRHLAKYMGTRAKGYCQLRHKEATGMYTATHAKLDRAKHFSVEEVAPIWNCTQISEQELHNIFETDHFEHDELYDAMFEPAADIVILMEAPEVTEFSLIAAGGVDRNRGNAEKLRHYWTVGEGGAKIRWGTGGDWTRCVRHLSKYLGPRARGYCALRHKEMTGLWTGDKAHRQMYGRKGNGVFAMSDEMLLTSEKVIDNASLRARTAEQKNRVILASGGFVAPAESEFGSRFEIPLVVPEGIETGDGRKFSKGAITMRDLPLPLMWQIKTDEGHYGSVVVGRIDHMERTDDGIGNAYGVFDNGEYGREAERLVRGGFLRGISADLDKFEADEEPEVAGDKSETKKGSGKILISKARVMGVTLVPKPAFQECTIQLAKEPDNMDAKEQDALIACASVVASIPVVPPREWFADPKLGAPTPLTVTDDGRVFGHIAAWHVDHIGLAFGTKPPRSKSKYAYFHTGVVRTDDGSDVPVGQLTLAGGHASLSADARAAAKHYDDTGSAFADVHAGEDAYGIWVAGSLRPEVSPQQVRAIRASAPSGDWRPIGGALELVAVCQVNVPGFPIARARVASGQMYALVAAGASYLARLKDDPEYMLQVAEDAKARFAALRGEIEKTTITAGIDMHNENEPLTVEVLERLLSDVVSFYFRAHGYHWNVTGEDFAQYHELFSDIYEDVYGSIDPLAENIRKLGGFPPFTLAEFVENRTLDDPKLEGGCAKCLAADLLLANEVIVEEIKSIYAVFNAANEQAICNFLADRLDMHQKWSWQLASSVTPDEIILTENEGSEDAFGAVFANLASEGLITNPEPWGDLAYISADVREKAAEKGFALPDGSYPIRNVKDLKNAIHAYGRSNPEDRAKVRAHIKKRAKALGKADLIPDTFSSAEAVAEDLAIAKAELSARVHGMTAAAPIVPEAGVEGSPKA